MNTEPNIEIVYQRTRRPPYGSRIIERLMALIYARMLDLMMSVDTPLPGYSRPSASVMRTRTSPSASVPPVTALML